METHPARSSSPQGPSLHRSNSLDVRLTDVRVGIGLEDLQRENRHRHVLGTRQGRRATLGHPGRELQAAMARNIAPVLSWGR